MASSRVPELQVWTRLCSWWHNADFHMLRQMESPTRSRRKVVRKDRLHYWRSLHNWVVYLQILIREILFHVNLECLGSKHAVKLSKGTWLQIKIREREASSRGIIQKCAPHEHSLCAPKFEDRSHEETLIQERCARKAAWDLAKNIYKLKNSDKATFHLPGEVKGMSTPVTSKKPEEPRIWSRFRSIDAHGEPQKNEAQKSYGTVKRSRAPTVVLTANGEVHTHEEAQVFVHDFNQFVTVQPLEETLAVLSLGKLCKDHGYSYEWVSGQEPRLSQKLEKHYLQDRQFLYLLSFQGYPLILQAVRLLQRHHKNRWDQRHLPASGNSAAASSSSDVGAKWRTSHKETWAGIFEKWQEGRKWSVGRYAILVRGFDRQSDSRRSTCTSTHFSELGFGTFLRKWQQSRGGTVFIFTSLKTEVATSAWEPK